MSNIYVAGASKEVELVEYWMGKLREAGHTITFDWTVDVRAATKSDAELTNAEQSTYATADLDGVEAADIVWILVPDNASTGCWVELGAAVAMRKDIIVSGNYKRCIFTSLAGGRFDTHADAFDAVCALYDEDPYA